MLSRTVYAIKLTICVDYMDNIFVYVVICCISCQYTHCTLYCNNTLHLRLFNHQFTNPLASALLIYPDAYRLISFLLDYVSACIVHCEYVINTLLFCYLVIIIKSCKLNASCTIWSFLPVMNSPCGDIILMNLIKQWYSIITHGAPFTNMV